MNLDSRTALIIIAMAAVPIDAHAQHIPLPIALGLLSPIFVLLLCIALGFLRRSFAVALRHIGFVIIWVTLFAVASYYVENDYIIWTPLAIYVGHAILVLALVLKGLWKRIAGTG